MGLGAHGSFIRRRAPNDYTEICLSMAWFPRITPILIIQEYSGPKNFVSLLLACFEVFKVFGFAH